MMVDGFLRDLEKLKEYSKNKVRQRCYKLKYGSAAPVVDDLIQINPNDVNYLLAPRFQRELSTFGTYVRSGEWDRNYTEKGLFWANNYEHKFNCPTLVNFDNYVFYQSVLKHFTKGVPWQQTEIYNWFLKNKDENIYRYETEERINQRLEWIDDLYHNIKNNGYKKQSEMGKENSALRSPEYFEVCVNIGRNGEIIFDDGRHRFAVAKSIGGINTIPARVLVRHAGWQKIRNKIAEADSKKDLSRNLRCYVDHPDIKNLSPD